MQLLQVESLMETVTKQLENEIKDKEILQDSLDTLRIEMAFLEERGQEMETAVKNETQAHQTTAAKLQVRNHETPFKLET